LKAFGEQAFRIVFWHMSQYAHLWSVAGIKLVWLDTSGAKNTEEETAFQRTARANAGFALDFLMIGLTVEANCSKLF